MPVIPGRVIPSTATAIWQSQGGQSGGAESPERRVEVADEELYLYSGHGNRQ